MFCCGSLNEYKVELHGVSDDIAVEELGLVDSKYNTQGRGD